MHIEYFIRGLLVFVVFFIPFLFILKTVSIISKRKLRRIQLLLSPPLQITLILSHFLNPIPRVIILGFLSILKAWVSFFTSKLLGVNILRFLLCLSPSFLEARLICILICILICSLWRRVFRWIDVSVTLNEPIFSFFAWEYIWAGREASIGRS